MSAFRRVVVVGAGLIGGSIELALLAREPGVSVVALDRGDSLDAVRTADLVVLAAPVRVNEALLAELRQLVHAEAIVTDVGSTKRSMVAAAGGMRFVGGHPVAGAAQGGRDFARADLFDGRPWILTPAPHGDPDDLARVRRFAESLGATVTIMPADEHDRLFAYLSHLPQLVASSLMAVAGTEAGLNGFAVAGNGLRDSTRLAASPADIWLDIARTNAPHIRAALDAMIAALARLRDDESGDALRETFERAASYKARLDEQR